MITNPIEETKPEGKTIPAKFICPDGDLIPLEPIRAIWVEEPRLFGKWAIKLEYEDGEGWTWTRGSRRQACDVRNFLILVFNATGMYSVVGDAGEQTRKPAP